VTLKLLTMKGILGVFVCGLLILSSCGSGVTVETPEDIGAQVMDVLKNFEGMSVKEFKSHMITIDEVHDLSKDKEVVTDAASRERLAKITKVSYLEGMTRMYNSLKERGEKYNIKWSKIELVSFSYEVENRKGLKSCQGKLFFKHGGATYRIRTYSLHDGSGYALANLRGLRKEK